MRVRRRKKNERPTRIRNNIHRSVLATRPSVDTQVNKHLFLLAHGAVLLPGMPEFERMADLFSQSREVCGGIEYTTCRCGTGKEKQWSKDL